jgi:hypothetical protein
MKKLLLWGGIFLVGIYGVLYYFSTQSDAYRPHTTVVAVVPSFIEQESTATPPVLTPDIIATTSEITMPTSTEDLSVAKEIIISPIIEKKPVVLIQEVSLTPLSKGKLGEGWNSNSWGLLKEKNNISFTHPWAAYSLYATSTDISNTYSVALVVEADKEAVSHLYLTFYNGKTRVGGVPLALYDNATSSAHSLIVPTADMKLWGKIITDILIESDATGTVKISSIALSPNNDSSKIALPEVIPEAGIPVPQAPLVPTVLAPFAETPKIYSAGLRGAWSVHARRVDIDLQNEERSITGKSIKVRFNSTSSALTIEHPRGIATKGYTTLNIFVYGGVTDHEWQELYVTLYDAAGGKLGTKQISDFAPSQRLQMQTWLNYKLQLSDFGAKDVVIKTIDIENASITQEGDSLWIDAVELEP